MSIRIWLKPEFTRHPTHRVGKQFGSGLDWKHHYLGEMEIREENERFYITVNDLDDPIPPSVEGYIEAYSFRKTFHTEPKRQKGTYILQSGSLLTTGELDSTSGTSYDLKIYGKSLGGIKTMYQCIREGIMIPTISWESEQMK